MEMQELSSFICFYYFVVIYLFSGGCGTKCSICNNFFFLSCILGPSQHRVVQYNIVAVHKVTELCKYQQQHYLQFICGPQSKLYEPSTINIMSLSLENFLFCIGHRPLQVGLFGNVNYRARFHKNFTSYASTSAYCLQFLVYLCPKCIIHNGSFSPLHISSRILLLFQPNLIDFIKFRANKFHSKSSYRLYFIKPYFFYYSLNQDHKS